MVKVLIQHDVADYDEWKPHFDEHDEVREEHGQQGYQLFRATDDENHVVALIEFDSMDNARSFVDSTALRKKMAEAGVQGDPEMTFLEQVETVQQSRQST
jgi:quinol monooxygenase YgiN